MSSKHTLKEESVDTNNTNSNKDAQKAQLAKARFHSFFVILITNILFVISFALLGTFMDNHFGTKPVFIITTLALGFPITQFVLYKYHLKTFKNE